MVSCKIRNSIVGPIFAAFCHAGSRMVISIFSRAIKNEVVWAKPLTNVFIGDTPSNNSHADQRNAQGNYLYPQLRNAGVGTPPPPRHEQLPNEESIFGDKEDV